MLSQTKYHGYVKTLTYGVSIDTTYNVIDILYMTPRWQLNISVQNYMMKKLISCGMLKKICSA